jgi:hypothetical protein
MARKKCPYCAEYIHGKAIYCRHCESNLLINSSSDPDVTVGRPEGDSNGHLAKVPRRNRNRITFLVLGIFLITAIAVAGSFQLLHLQIPVAASSSTPSTNVEAIRVPLKSIGYEKCRYGLVCRLYYVPSDQKIKCPFLQIHYEVTTAEKVNVGSGDQTFKTYGEAAGIYRVSSNLAGASKLEVKSNDAVCYNFTRSRDHSEHYSDDYAKPISGRNSSPLALSARYNTFDRLDSANYFDSLTSEDIAWTYLYSFSTKQPGVLGAFARLEPESGGSKSKFCYLAITRDTKYAETYAKNQSGENIVYYVGTDKLRPFAFVLSTTSPNIRCVKEALRTLGYTKATFPKFVSR